MRRTNRLEDQQVVGLQQISTAITLGEAIKVYEKHLQRRNVSSYTLQHEMDNLRAVVKRMPKDTLLLDISTEDLEKQVFDEMRQKLKAVTINGRIKTVRRLFKVCMELNLCSVNVANQLTKVIEHPQSFPSLTLEQFKKILSVIDMHTFTGLRDAVMISTMYDTALRLRETLSLEVSQVDLDQRFFRKVPGKNGKIEDIPFSRKLAGLLKKYLDVRGEFSTTALFVTLDGKPIQRRTVQDRIHNLGKLAGIEGVRVSPHTFRHSLAREWVLNGGDPYVLQRVMRHSNMDMVRRYIHLWGSEIQEQHDKFSPLENL
ncbi:tyrosine-type recombinase/integrase [Alicyclobacillus tolerans]|uniref:tyrosine-type recombinase/integrase n=1 Tax=Alicyclobacillus tolerans TaxID=90970 RepID=UPI001F026A5B|nr:tyrosine-type recombinase/integrase [Alicyclobacillus tolerans]MCF8566218.1 tyrosine-type recombinase/integrase [Alicyclobacillus tolerans]